MNIRLFNNTDFDDDHIMSDIKYFAQLIDTSLLESIEINDKSISFMGIDCCLGEYNLNEDIKVSGNIRWFDEKSGLGYIRLNNGRSIHFYSCNVNDSNSLYPQLVNNIQFNEGDNVTATFTCDRFKGQSLGLINVTKEGNSL